ncbi:hypothetical protein LG202_09920 [Methylobacillus methanolivorans]
MLEINEEIYEHLSSHMELDQRDDLLKLIQKFDDMQIPAIITFDIFARTVNINKKSLAAMCYGAEKFYRTFKIPKRSGGMRQIDSPFPSLSLVQKWISNNILEKLDIDNESACAYIKEKSIKNHVEKHIDSAFILKIDLQDYYPTISTRDIIYTFSEIGYPVNISTSIAHILSLNGGLPQGAPSSPLLSNIITLGLDVKIKEYCQKNNFLYSRYADDLAISGENISEDNILEIYRLISSEGFIVNTSKSKLYTPKQPVRHLTGLIINNGKIRIPKQTRKMVRQKLFYIRNYYLSDLESSSNHNLFSLHDPLLLERVLGYLNFWLWIEPDSEFATVSIQEIKSIKTKLLESI